MSEAIRSVVVAGTGPLAWIAAAGLFRAFRHRQLAVTVVDSGVPGDARIGQWTLPSQRGMHALLGIAEPHLVHSTGATFRLASAHVGWQGDGSNFLHAHGEIGAEMTDTPFYKYLQSEAIAGRPERPEAFSLAGAAARLGKFARPMGGGKSIAAGFTYGFHFADQAYAQYLRAHALRLGVRESPAPLAEPEIADSGDIRGLRLADGQTLAADFFVDCSGPAARLLGRVSSAPRDDWRTWLPCDRMWSAFGAPAHEPPAVTQTIASSAGWSWRAPLARATLYGHVYSSNFTSDDAALAALESHQPGLREPVLARFSAGRRRDFWERNCVALGSATVEIEPLAGADLHLAQIGLATFIELFPRSRASRIESAEYNRLMGEHADALRDFTIAHYRAGAPRRGEFWAATRAAAAPARLADKLDLYAASGRINLLDHETFEETDWAWLLIGSGCVPAALELQIRLRLEKLAPQEISALRIHVQQVAASMPPHAEFVRRQAELAARSPRS